MHSLKLTTSAQRQHHVKGSSRFDLGFVDSKIIVKIVTKVDKLLLRRVDAFLLFHQLLDAHDLVGGLDVDGDVAPGQGLDLDLHEDWVVCKARKRGEGGGVGYGDNRLDASSPPSLGQTQECDLTDYVSSY